MRAKPGKEQDLRDALEALIQPTRQEEGYINYDLHQGIEDPSLFYLYENWETVDTRAISPDTALRLSRALGTSDRFWMNLQTRYDLAVQLARHRAELDKIARLVT